MFVYPGWNVYGEVVDDRRDEEMLNDCFADLIDDSLTHGPGYLNFLFDGVVMFEDDAEVIATDQDPLPYRSGGNTDRKIDFTVADASKIVGFESKRRDSLKESQLSDEREKLEYNADGRDVVFVVITEHLGKPDIISRIPGDVRWVSWYAIAQRAFESDALGHDWLPTVSRAQKMFREFGYSEFTGIDDEEFRVTIWELWKQIAIRVDGLETDQRWPHKMLKTAVSGNDGFRPIDPDWMMLTYGPEPEDPPKETSYVVLSNKKSRDVWIGVALDPYHRDEVRDELCGNAESIARRVLEEDLEVIQFPLNWLVGRKNLHPDHKKAVTARFPGSKDELTASFSDRAGMKNDGANRFVLGYQLSSSDILEKSIQYIHTLEKLFAGIDGPELQRLLD